MPASSPSRVRPQLSDPALSEESRAFYQQRIASFGKWVFWPGFAFLVVAYPPPLIAGVPAGRVLGLGFACHFLAVGVLVAMWLGCRGGTARSAATLRRLDGLGAVAVCLLWTGMGAGHLSDLAEATDPRLESAMTGFTVLLACTHTVLARAILVPSTFRRTLAVGLFGMLGILGLVGVSMHVAGYHPGDIAGGLVATSVWCGAAIIASASTSRVIFGLRREVARTRRLGQYTIERKIGGGGMGEVYRASHAMLRRPTAIKLLHPEATGGESLLRFEREVQLTAGLSHPNTVSVYDYGRTPDGLFYYAMEFLDGVDLDRLVRARGPIGAGRTIAVLEQVCGSLAEAHGIGLIHRDIKPANIILCPRGGEYDVVKVVDFGLVKELENASVELSAANTLMGTPAFLSPEAIRGDEIDGRADLYALGAVGYWLLTGTTLFEGNLVEMCSHHLHTEPTPPAERAPDRDIPGDLSAVILRCLAKDPGERHASAVELRAALRGCADAGSWTAADAESWWREYAADGEGELEDVGSMPTVAVDLDDRLDDRRASEARRAG